MTLPRRHPFQDHQRVLRRGGTSLRRPVGAYGSSKAALRMAGMVLAEELGSQLGQATGPRDVAILSCEPGIVETDMQSFARSRSSQEFPWVGTFLDFQAEGRLVSPELPGAEMVAFLESDRQPRFQERRLRAWQLTAGNNRLSTHRTRDLRTED